MFRKKRKPLFGGEIPPDCAYCYHNGAAEGSPVCTLHKAPPAETCRAYLYNPLLREPRPAPPLRTGKFGPEDFKL